MPRQIHEFRHRARQRRESQPHPDAGEDDLLLRFDYEKVSGRVVPGDGFLVESRTVIGQYCVFVEFSCIKQFSSVASIESYYTEKMTEYLFGMGVPEALFAPIIDSVFLAIGMADDSPRLPLDVGIWDMTWVDESECEPSVVPAARSSIEGLERVRLVELQDQVIRHTPSCAICLEDFAAQQQDGGSVQVLVTHLPCSHLYHLDCVVQCLERSNLCPICRYPMPTQDQTS